MGSVRTTTYTQTQTLDWVMQLFVGLPVGVLFVKSTMVGSGLLALISANSHIMSRTRSVFCCQVARILITG